MTTFAERINNFNAALKFDRILPDGFAVMNPFVENPWAIPASSAFYRKYYNDNNIRCIILGINPGRFGAGLTGVPFTDPKKLKQFCDIHIEGLPDRHEPSSEFIYEVITAYGSPEKFYSNWYINSICPLGFTRLNNNNKFVNYNYYDNKTLQNAALPFILETLPIQLKLGVNSQICLCLGQDKNTKFLEKINSEHNFFHEIIALPHPRYIMQYKRKEKEKYIELFIDTIKKCEKF